MLCLSHGFKVRCVYQFHHAPCQRRWHRPILPVNQFINHAEMKNKKPDNKAKTEKFIETARGLECDETGKKFEEAFDKIIPPPKHPNN